MLGEKLGEDTGKVSGVRFLPGADGKHVRMEVSFQATGKLLGIEVSDMGTYTAYERLPGVLYGEGQGFIATKDGEGIIWNGFGVGQMTGQGMGVKWRAAVTYQTSSKKLARLNTVIGMVEHETDPQGNVKDAYWEWK